MASLHNAVDRSLLEAGSLLRCPPSINDETLSYANALLSPSSMVLMNGTCDLLAIANIVHVMMHGVSIELDQRLTANRGWIPKLAAKGYASLSSCIHTYIYTSSNTRTSTNLLLP